MQNLWSRAARSQSSCRCVSCLSTTASGVTSRSAGAASKKKLRIGNSVTALYTSIFAAAALADARAKSQRRNDWEEKIAAVKAEVNELVDEEQRLLESLESRRRNTRGINRLLQARGFGAVMNLSPAPRRVTPNQPTRSFHTERSLLSAANAQLFESTLAEEAASFENAAEAEIDDIGMEDEALPGWAHDEPLRVKAIQKLAVRQFAIRLLLRPIIAHRYSGVSMNYAADFDLPQINTPKLLEELNTVRHRIRALKSNRYAHYDDVIGDYASIQHEDSRKDTERLDAELNRDIELYTKEQMSLQELLMRVSSNLLASAEPDRTAAFRYILIAFSQAKQNDVNDLLLRTLLPNAFNMSTSLIITIISFFRKSKNLKDFDLFLRMLSGHGVYSLNLGSLGRYRVRKVNGVEIVVPPLDSNNPVIYCELIAAALRFDQPDRADAWLQAARRIGFFDNFTTLFYYIRFYSIRQDWEKGINTLRRATTFLVSSTDHQTHMVERLLMLMVHLCDSCVKKEVSEVLITAAMRSGFDPAIPSSQSDVLPIVDRDFARWTEAAQTSPRENADRPLWKKCFDFVNNFGEELNEFEAENHALALDRASWLALHAQDAFSTTLAGNTLHDNIGKDAKPTAISSSATLRSINSPRKAQSDEMATLRNEIDQLRGLVFELRKHHIESSIKEESHEVEQEAPSAEPAATSSTLAPETSNTPKNVEFERISEMIDSDRTLPPSEVSSRPFTRRFPKKDTPTSDTLAQADRPKGFRTIASAMAKKTARHK